MSGSESLLDTYVALVVGDPIDQDFCVRCFRTIVSRGGEKDWWHLTCGDLHRSCRAAGRVTGDSDAFKVGLGPRLREFLQIRVV